MDNRASLQESFCFSAFGFWEYRARQGPLTYGMRRPRRRAESKRALIPIGLEGARGDDGKSQCHDGFPRYFSVGLYDAIMIMQRDSVFGFVLNGSTGRVSVLLCLG